MPFAYIVHLRSFIVLWLAGLPFAFVPQLGYWAILVCTVVGYGLFPFFPCLCFPMPQNENLLKLSPQEDGPASLLMREVNL